MTHDLAPIQANAPAITQATGRPLPPVSAPASVADAGLIRIGAAVGRPAGR
jgi:hypothetical protein